MDTHLSSNVENIREKDSHQPQVTLEWEGERKEMVEEYFY